MVREGTEASAISAAHSCPTAAPSTPLDCTAGVCQQSYLGGGSPSTCPRRTSLDANHFSPPCTAARQGSGQHSC